MLGAAFFYSLATVRLGSWATQVPALQLAASKSVALAIFALTWLTAFAAVQGAWQPGSFTPMGQHLSATPLQHA